MNTLENNFDAIEKLIFPHWRKCSLSKFLTGERKDYGVTCAA